MNHRRVNKRTALTAGAAAAALAGAAVLLPNADASPETTPDTRAFSQQQAADTGGTLTGELGRDAAGWFYEADTKQLVVNVLDEQAAERVRASGAQPREVAHSTATLRSTTRALRAKATVPGTAWSLDPRTNTVRVVADRTVAGGAWNRLTRVTGQLSDTVTVERYAGEFTPYVADGGDPIFGNGSRCSLGFNVQVQEVRGFLTAGHCGEVGSGWTEDQQGGTPLGTTAVSEFPGSDFAVVTYEDQNAEAPGTVDLGDGSTQAITGAAEASVGMPVQRSGSTTGLAEGQVTGLDATVNYGNGDIVTGLIETDVCAEPGDSGGPLFSGESAVGLTSGGSGDCAQGGITFFQPVTAALEAVGGQLIDTGAEQPEAPPGSQPESQVDAPPEQGFLPGLR